MHWWWPLEGLRQDEVTSFPISPLLFYNAKSANCICSRVTGTGCRNLTTLKIWHLWFYYSLDPDLSSETQKKSISARNPQGITQHSPLKDKVQVTVEGGHVLLEGVQGDAAVAFSQGVDAECQQHPRPLRRQCRPHTCWETWCAHVLNPAFASQHLAA